MNRYGSVLENVTGLWERLLGSRPSHSALGQSVPHLPSGAGVGWGGWASFGSANGLSPCMPTLTDGQWLSEALQSEDIRGHFGLGGKGSSIDW